MCICFYLLAEFYELSGTLISYNRYLNKIYIISRTPPTPLPDFGFDIVKEVSVLR